MHGFDIIHTRPTNPLKGADILEPGGSGENTHARDTERPQKAQGVRMGFRDLQTPNGQTSNTRHIETPVLQSAVSVNNAKQLFTTGPNVVLPLATSVPSLLHLKSFSMT